MGVRYVLLMILPGSSSVIGRVSDERMIAFPAPDGGNGGISSATSANERVMVPEPIGSHPIPEPDAGFIDQVIGQVNAGVGAQSKWVQAPYCYRDY